MAKKKCPECKEGAPDWLVTFSDMVTLLMCFFVLLLIFMQPKEEVKLMRVLEEVQVALGSSGSPGRVPNNAIPVMSLIPRQDAVALYRTVMRARRNELTIITRTDMETSVEQPRNTKSISGNLEFMQRSAELTEAVKAKLLEVVNDVRGINNVVFIRGHATREEVAGLPDEDLQKWTLSYRRALNIMEFLKRRGIQEDHMRLELVADTEDDYKTGNVSPRAEILITDLMVDDYQKPAIEDGTSTPGS